MSAVTTYTFDKYSDVLTAKDVASIMGIGYVKALKLIKYGNLPHIKVGNAYRVSKKVFINWINDPTSKEIALDE